jgi:DNA adenine methylase
VVRFVSPLRYPGGKAALATFVGHLISLQRPRCSTLVEPYAGGAGAALKLLVGEYVDRIVLNELDVGIAAFWRCVFHGTDELIDRISSVPLSIDEWYRQAEIYRDGTAGDAELGFATFYLNRTNRSGILTARPIGGVEQSGKWLIGARFNRSELSSRIKVLSKYRNRVDLTEKDAVTFLKSGYLNDPEAFFYVDPPYLGKGPELYLNDLTWDDHLELATLLTRSKARWLVTYDCDDRIMTELYPGRLCVRFDIKHTAHRQHIGTELAVFAERLIIDSIATMSTGDVVFVDPGSLETAENRSLLGGSVPGGGYRT